MTYQAGSPSASQPSGLVSGSVSSQPSNDPTSGASKPPKKKFPVRVDGDGQVVGENSAKFTTKAGKYIRSTIPIIFDKWPLVPRDFKDKLWKRLTDKFEFNVPEKLVRPKLEKHFPSIWSGAKSRYRTEIIRKAESLEECLKKCPDGVDPNHWSEFIFKQEDPEVQEVCARNARNRSSYKGGHTLGRRSYAQRLDILKNEEPEKKHSRVNVWMVGCKRVDGTILDSVREKFDKVEEAHSKQSEKSSNEDADTDNFVDINEDALTQVFGRDKRNRTRGVSSHISNKQFQQTAIAKVLLEQTSSSNTELKNDVAEIKANMNTLMAMVKQGGCNGAGNSQPPSAAYTPGTDLGTDSVNPHPTPQNLVKPPSAAYTLGTDLGHGSVNRHSHPTPKNLVKPSSAAYTPGTNFASGSVNRHPHPTPQNLLKPPCAPYTSGTDFGPGSVNRGPRPSPQNLVKPPSAACTNGTDFVPGSVNPMSQPTPQNLVNLVRSRECNKNSSIKRKVTLLGKNMDAIAEGYVVTDMTAGICHFRKVMQGEKKVEVTKVFDTSAPVYDGPQSDYSTMQDIVDGGFLIWLEARLQY